MSMRMREAKNRLKKLADGKYYSISYEFSEYVNSKPTNRCTTYIDGYSHCSGKTWEESLNKIKNLIKPSTNSIYLEDCKLLDT